MTSEVKSDSGNQLSDLNFIYYHVNLASKSLTATISRIFPGEKPARDQRRGARTLVKKHCLTCYFLQALPLSQTLLGQVAIGKNKWHTSYGR